MKKMSKHLRAKVLLSLALCFCNTMASYALPSQGTLNNTAATINVNNNQMTISGKGNNNIINWATFNVATGETVNFNDKNNYLNLVHGIDMSRIYGTISGGNIVYLVNPNGILFGQGAKLDNIGSFIASTRNISSINQTEFLNNPANTEGVLGSNTNGMDNKVFYPDGSGYVPKITVAETQLTNVPNSVNTIVLDGPGGVILKNTAALDQVAKIYTKKNGGEIGIGTDSGNITLTQAQKDKIKLINGSVTEAYQDNANVLNKYTAIQSIDDLKSLGNSSNPQQKNLMLWNDIDATGVTDYNPVNASGTFEGMGYRISALQIADNPNSSGDSTLSAGVFGEFSGNIRNLSVEGVNFKGLSGYQNIGGVVGHLKGGILSNVFASGEIKGEIDWNKMANIGGLVGVDDTNNTYSEIRNSGSNVFIDALGSADWDRRYFAVGGLIGKQNNNGGLYNVYNTGNVNISLSQQYVYLGGLVGYVNNSQNYDILGATNTGSLSSKQGNTMWVQQHVNLGGIVGAVKDSNVRIGETSNFGNINDEKINIRHYTNDPEQFIINAGGILGRSYGSENADNIEIVSVDNKPLNNLYLANQGNVKYNTNFGESKTLSEMSGLYDNNMRGIYNIEGIGNGAYSVYVVPGGNDSGTSGGNTGGNGSSTTGGSTGGNNSGSTIIYTGGNNSGSTGGNAGGNNSGSIGGNAGGNNSGSANGGITYYAGSYEGTTSDTEMILLENGANLQDYKSNTVVVVMDPNNSENSKVYISKDPVVTVITDAMKEGLESHINFEKDLNTQNKNLEDIKSNYKYQEDALYDKIYELLSKAKEKHERKVDSAVGESYLQMKDKIELSNTTIKKDDIPEEVYQAFLKPVTDKLKNSSLKPIDPDVESMNFFNSILRPVFMGVQSIEDPDPVRVNNINYRIHFDNSYSYAGRNTIRATVQWMEDKEKKSATLTLPKLNDEKVIANYTKALAKLAEDVTENALVEFYTFGLQDVTDKGKIIETKDFAKNICAALVDNNNADTFINSLGEKASSYIKNKWGFSSKGKLGSFLNESLNTDFTGLLQKLDNLNNEKDKYVDNIKKAKSDNEIDRSSAGYWIAEKAFTTALNAIK